MLVPLLVNAHDHGRGFGNVRAGIPDAPLETWIASLGSQMGTTTQEVLVGDGCRAMLTSGVGATVICVNPLGRDTAAEVLAAVKAATETGRAAVVYPFADAIGNPLGRDRDFPGWSPGELDRHLEAFERSMRRSRTRSSRCNSAPWAPSGSARPLWPPWAHTPVVRAEECTCTFSSRPYSGRGPIAPTRRDF